jgi:hypothetical protein
MPNDVKAYVSAAVAVAAIILAYWSGSPVRPQFGNFVLAMAASMIVASRFFRRPAEKSKCRKKTAGENSATPVLKAWHYCCSAECLPLAKRWGNRPAFLWIAEDFGCCASG